MINMILGQPGGGKSYEAVAFHILPNLEDGRRVVTNLPLNLQAFYGAVPESRKLLEIRTKSTKESAHCFSVREDFIDDWRDENTGRGALFVIDECHKMYPRIGCDKLVLEFFAEHRHAGIDIILITQAYGKIHADIRDMVQMVYRVKKMTAFGKSDRYIRKVQDGIRGEVMSTSERDYESKFFQFYKSHTATSSSVNEADAKDVSPRYKKWLYASAAFVVLPLLFMSYKLYANHSSTTHKADVGANREGTPLAGRVPDLTNITPPAVIASEVAQKTPAIDASEPQDHPFKNLSLHLQGVIKSSTKTMMTFIVTQNEQPINQISSDELIKAGYKVTYVSDCVAKLQYEGIKPFFVVCSMPSVAPVPSITGLSQSVS